MFTCGLAQNLDEVAEAQRLRFRVFSEELGARLAEGPTPGLDEDRFDPHCDHLLVRDAHSGRVVGTYRLLGPEGARKAGGFYADTEFDLTRLASLRASIVEIGRACVDPEHRDGAVLTRLWGGVTRYVLERGLGYVMGCASVGLGDGGRTAAAVCDRLRHEQPAPPAWRVFPHRPFPLRAVPPDPDALVPPLIRGYLRLGAYVCGDPALDEAFGTADLLMLLPVARLDARWARRYGRDVYRTRRKEPRAA
jgi:putative hemolysin